jgi:FMN phosphatase YigB (HAD superfamily)
VGAEKPNPCIFEAACQQLQLPPHEVVHVGDDRRNDVFGARDAGCYAWLWGLDVCSFDEVADRVLYGEESSDDEQDTVHIPHYFRKSVYG